MTAAVYRSGTPSLSVPESQNTAPVLEFNCLYTHDIRRKQKRWQDGFLRFHTFNKRVMVYDVPRNFIGDAHWKSEEPLQDGDEVTLEKGGVMVQVAESVGQTETDLTELRQRKNKNSSEKGSSPIGPSRPTAPQRTGTAQPLGLKHRSLNALLGTPKGPIGKAALPSKSPFEERQANVVHQDRDENRPSKRQRIDLPQAWNVTRTARPSVASPTKETPLWARTADSIKKKRNATVGKAQRTLATKEVIDLCEEEDEPRDRFLPGFSSDALAPSSPPRAESASRAPRTKQSRVRSSSPAFQTQKISRAERATAKDRATNSVAKVTSKMDQNLQSAHVEPPRATKVGRTAVEDFIDVNSEAQQRPRSKTGNNEPLRNTESRSGRTLRIAASAPKKKMLLCQDQLSKGSSRSNATISADDVVQFKQSQMPRSPKGKGKTQQDQLRDRLAKIAAKERERDPRMLDEENEFDWAIVEADQTFGKETEPTGPRRAMITTQEQNALELAELDQMILPAAQSPSPRAESPQQQQDIRQLRRVVSEATVIAGARSGRVPGAPVRYTPSPAKKTPSVEPSESEASPAKRVPCLPSKARSKKPFQRAVSLNTASNGTSTVILAKPFQLPKPPQEKSIAPAKAQAPDPWSREAFDLFTWRPPGFDEENWCVEVSETIV